MVLGALISALSLIAIWLVPPVWGEYSKFLYLIAVSLVFYTGNTLFLVPYTGLGLALSDDYRERTNLFAYKAVVDALGGFLIPWFYWLVTRPCFESTLHGTRVLSLGWPSGSSSSRRFRSVSAGSVTTGASPARRRCRS